MASHFPGIRALRGFEAAGRHLNFSRAAAELGLTPAAISHQIKEIEEQLGVTLFSRTSRSMQLTVTGEILHGAATEALTSLERGVVRIRKIGYEKQLKVIASTSIAAKWLVPRISRFIQLYPDIDVRLDISSHLRDFAPGDVDVAIRWGQGTAPNLRSEKLFENAVFPVCSPRLLESELSLNDPHDLLQHRLIHVSWSGQDVGRPDWRMWLHAAGITSFDQEAGTHFDESGPAIQAAIEGLGVALGDSSLVADDLAAGRLVRPFALSINSPAKFAYYVVSPTEVADSPMVSAFREWVLEEAAKMPLIDHLSRS